MIKNNNLKPYYTFLSLPLKITIALRWNPGIKKGLEKCVGEGCKEIPEVLQNTVSTTPTSNNNSQANNAAAELLENSASHTTLPATNVTAENPLVVVTQQMPSAPPSTDHIQRELLDTMMPTIQTGTVSTLVPRQHQLSNNNNSSQECSVDLFQEGLDLARAHGVPIENIQIDKVHKMLNTSEHIKRVQELITILEEQRPVTMSIITKWLQCYHDYEELKKNKISYSPCDDILYNKLELWFATYKQNVEHYVQECKTNKKEVGPQGISHCYTQDNYKEEIERYKAVRGKVIAIMENVENKTYSEDDILAVLEESKIIQFPDAIYYKTFIEEGKSQRILCIEKKSEGPQILSEFYYILSEKDSNTEGIVITEEMARNILAEIEKGNFTIGKSLIQPKGKILIESGLSKHVMLIIPDPTSEYHLLVIASLTSSKDKDTFTLTTKQYDFDLDIDQNEKEKKEEEIPSSKNKEQRIRILRRIVRITKEEFKEKKKSDEYLQEQYRDNSVDMKEHKEISVREKIIESFKVKAKNIFSHNITPPKEYTIEDLLESAKIQCEAYIKENETNKALLELRLSKLSDTDRALAEDDLKAKAALLQKQKEEQAYYETLPRDKQIAYNILKRITEKKKLMEKEQEKAEKQIHSKKMKEKYAHKKKEKTSKEEQTNNNNKSNENN